MKKILCCLALLGAGTAGAAVIRVPADQPTIQAGLNAAAAGDTVLVAPGLYSGSGNYDLDFAGRDLVLLSENGPDETIIDCQYNGRGFYFHTNETAAAVVDGFAVRHGYAFGGAGINVENAGPTIRRCIFSDSQSATQGGGIHVAFGNPSFIHCAVHNCFAAEGGGVSAEYSEVVINSCIVAASASSG
ncbi:MAG: hypothetical protein C4524_09650 [Candidatus Zixiibacteriota bacterium]|nr:MAG: hypothetical protein C4524_09650 [candidate division Zixibacteria bacterium]